ncbi:MAG: T9SS type A sorting domain-containing protein, partial [Deltaproteobacteria bacterium]|nr:T9SS type A sorting domain-containing protein [Deltaproteobacteria bacterium]
EPNYTGLVLKCNTYNDNSYGEMVTRENPTGVEGIAFHQGDPTPSSGQDLAGNTFSPYHASVQIAETDIKNEGNFINYYHHNLHPDYRVKPEYYTLSLVLPVQKNYDFYTTDCPSCLGSGGSQEEMKDAMAAETDSIDLLLTGLASIVDGGDTEGMNDDIFFSTPPDALSLHQDLLGESPYLSDTVIKSSIAKEEVLPNAMIRDILVANPQSSKSTEVMDKLNERFIPMPDPMMDEILAGQTQISAKEILEGKIAVHELNRKNLFSKLVRSYKSDTINMSSQDSLISMLQGEISLKAKYLLAFEFLGTDDTAQVINTLNSIPGNFTLTGARQALHNDYQEYFEVLLGLKSENRSILELDSGQMTTLQDLVTLGHEPVKSYARNILLANQLFEYHEPILLPELNNPSGSKPITISEQQTSNTYFRLYPNPTNQYAIIEYCLAEYSDSQKSSIFVITTQEGKVIDRIMVNKQQDQFILNTTGYLPGTYLCTMFYEGKSLQSQKFVIIR